MLGDLSTQFQARRPLLQHVAGYLQTDVEEVLTEKGVSARTAFSVLTSEEFTSRVDGMDSGSKRPLTDIVDQIYGVIEIRDVQEAARIQTLIGQNLAVHSSEWMQDQDRSVPVLELVCVVPPQAMPEGWVARDDVPSMFKLRITKAEVPTPSQSDTLPILAFPDPDAPFPLVMKGGGIKGLAYVGALSELNKRYRFNWFVGTSAGAITAVLLGAGYTPDELLKIMAAKDFRDFFDAPLHRIPLNLLLHHGCYRADTFTEWLDELLAKKLRSLTRVKLSDLPYRVTVYAARRGQRTLRFDSVDADADAAYAARCSMSIPYFFTPQQDQGIRTYDGGIHQNYPVEQLLQQYPDLDFISLYLGSEVYEPVRQGRIASDLLSIMTEGADAETVSRYRSKTVIIDPRPIGTLDFDLTDDEKSFLLACGRAGSLSHLSDGSPEHLEAIRVRDELKAKVDQNRILKKRGKQRARRIKLGAVAAIAIVLYAAYRFFM